MRVLPREERVQRDFVNVYQYLMVGNKDVEARLFSVTCNRKTGGSMHKLKSRKIQLKTRKGVIPVESLKSLG